MLTSCFHFAFWLSPPVISNDADEDEAHPGMSGSNPARRRARGQDESQGWRSFRVLSSHVAEMFPSGFTGLQGDAQPQPDTGESTLGKPDCFS